MTNSKQTEAIREALAEQPAPGRAHYEDGDVFERISAMKKQPAQRTWVGLTDEDIASLDLSAVTVKDAISDVRAVEAKLREKNGITKEQT